MEAQHETHRRSASGRSLILGAIDAGSNAMRAAVAVCRPGGSPVILSRLRLPVRLGERVFLEQRLSADLVVQAAEAFARFRAMFDSYGVERYRAVATSAVREAENRHLLVEIVRRTTRIELQAIDGKEEARLVRQAVCKSFAPEARPDLIADLGGGSLELSALYRGELVHAAALPIGTVRLMQTLGWKGPIPLAAAQAKRAALLAHLQREVSRPPREPRTVVLAGGNATTLAKAYPAAAADAAIAVDLAAIERDLPALLGATVEERMARFQVGRDRAEVMAIAALVFVALGEWLGIERALVPGLGVLDGVLGDLAELGVARQLGALPQSL